MAERIDDGGPAFPVPEGALSNVEPGMSLRDYFAAAVVSPMLMQAYGTTPDALAMRAYEIADAMLAARERQS